VFELLTARAVPPRSGLIQFTPNNRDIAVYNNFPLSPLLRA
jgi:hypothetical protein